ncbi:MAG TPA: hypothetical protein VHW04_07195 [Solirubrobacteraceae bacterium]|nr:hypothetical protein [Solirubrobacteraceae bacterium]
MLACVRPLTRAQEHLIHTDRPVNATPADEAPRAPRVPAARRNGGRRAAGLAVLARATAISAGATVAVVIGVLSGVGLLHSLRQLHWLTAGPSVPDALPLLQLAGFAGQPLGRVLAAWVPAGVVLSLALIRFPATRRALLIVLFGAVLLLATVGTSGPPAREPDADPRRLRLRASAGHAAGRLEPRPPAPDAPPPLTRGARGTGPPL